MINDLKTKELERIFKKLDVETRTCSHHVRGFVVVDGKDVLPIHYSNGKSGLHGPNLHKFRKALNLDLEQFFGLVTCTFSRDDFIDVLREKGII